MLTKLGQLEHDVPIGTVYNTNIYDKKSVSYTFNALHVLIALNNLDRITFQFFHKRQKVSIKKEINLTA